MPSTSLVVSTLLLARWIYRISQVSTASRRNAITNRASNDRHEIIVQSLSLSFSHYLRPWLTRKPNIISVAISDIAEYRAAHNLRAAIISMNDVILYHAANHVADLFASSLQSRYPVNFDCELCRFKYLIFKHANIRQWVYLPSHQKYLRLYLRADEKPQFQPHLLLQERSLFHYRANFVMPLAFAMSCPFHELFIVTSILSDFQ